MASTDQFTRRAIAQQAGLALSTVSVGSVISASSAHAADPHIAPVAYGDRPKPKPHEGHLSIGCLIFPGLDQIDFTGPFEVFSRVPDSSVEVVAKTRDPVRDIKGLLLTPTVAIAEAPVFDVLAVAGGLGQQNYMDDPEIVGLIERHDRAGRIVFSVCTGGLLCGAAGLLRGRKATTHWAAVELLGDYGATPVNARVVVDGNYVSTAGVTAGLDGALLLSSLLRGDKVAEEIQLDIQYAPKPVFHSGTPEEASADVIAAFYAKYGANRQARKEEAARFAKRFAAEGG